MMLCGYVFALNQHFENILAGFQDLFTCVLRLGCRVLNKVMFSH